MVSQDGTQRPPLHFPQGGHLLAFLSCLENGLLPCGQLEPPLWSQQGKVLTAFSDGLLVLGRTDLTAFVHPASCSTGSGH